MRFLLLTGLAFLGFASTLSAEFGPRNHPGRGPIRGEEFIGYFEMDPGSKCSIPRGMIWERVYGGRLDAILADWNNDRRQRETYFCDSYECRAGVSTIEMNARHDAFTYRNPKIVCHYSRVGRPRR